MKTRLLALLALLSLTALAAAQTFVPVAVDSGVSASPYLPRVQAAIVGQLLTPAITGSEPLTIQWLDAAGREIIELRGQRAVIVPPGGISLVVGNAQRQIDYSLLGLTIDDFGTWRWLSSRTSAWVIYSAQ